MASRVSVHHLYTLLLENHSPGDPTVMRRNFSLEFNLE